MVCLVRGFLVGWALKARSSEMANRHNARHQHQRVFVVLLRTSALIRLLSSSRSPSKMPRCSPAPRQQCSSCGGGLSASSFASVVSSVGATRSVALCHNGPWAALALLVAGCCQCPLGRAKHWAPSFTHSSYPSEVLCAQVAGILEELVGGSRHSLVHSGLEVCVATCIGNAKGADANPSCIVLGCSLSSITVRFADFVNQACRQTRFSTFCIAVGGAVIELGIEGMEETLCRIMGEPVNSCNPCQRHVSSIALEHWIEHGANMSPGYM